MVLYYSYTGKVEKLAKAFGAANNTAVIEVKSAGEIGKLEAYTIGCFKAKRGQSMPIAPVAFNLAEDKTVDVFAPIWASSIAPPMIAALEQLAKSAMETSNKSNTNDIKVKMHMVSFSGKSDRSRIAAKLESLGLEMVGYEDLRG